MQNKLHGKAIHPTVFKPPQPANKESDYRPAQGQAATPTA
jgi:hypothetical protein